MMAILHIFRRKILIITLGVILFIVLLNNTSEQSNTFISEIAHLKDSTLSDSKLKDFTDSFKPPEGSAAEGKAGDTDKAAEHPEPILEPCTIINPLTNQFYDLRSLSSIGSNEIQAWNSKGFDSGKNFSIGICSSPLRQVSALTDLDFTDSENKSTIAGYYSTQDGHKVSIGSVSTDLKFRGMNLVLEYTDGDRCENSPNLRKSTLLTFKCDREMMSKARVNYLGAMDNCSYFFEVRTVHACATANEENDTAIWGIFLLIISSAIAVYFFAGIIYKFIKDHYERNLKLANELV